MRYFVLRLVVAYFILLFQGQK